MRRAVQVRVLAILAALAIGIVAMAATGERTAAGGPVYSVSQAVAGLRHHPRAWAGRTIRVMGLAELSYAVCGTPIRQCGPNSYFLVDYPSYQAAGPIPILPLRPDPDPLLTHLRQLPGLGRWLPGPQPILGAGTYLVELRPVARSDLCSGQSCYEAVLPDAGSPPE